MPLVQLVYLVLPSIRELQVLLDQLETLVHLVATVRLAHLVLRDLQVQPDQLELPAVLERQGQ